MKYVIVCLVLGLVGCKGKSGDSIVGQRGQVGAIGVVGPQGPAGNDGTNGVDGQNGTNGSNGLDGAVGPKGEDGTVITPIQFCPNVVPTYPSTFPESGLCINGNIFAVYSANDGFLALIPPGVYSSNAIGSSCTFTVLANCQIQ